MTQQLIIGDDCIDRTQSLFINNNWAKILLVTGKESYQSSGAEKFIENCLHDHDSKPIRFSDFSSNPNIIDLKKGLLLGQEEAPSVIIAIGGGSVLDMGKLIRFFLTHDGEVLGSDYRTNGKSIPLIAVPTTAGTGAEATHFAVLYDEHRTKHSIADEDILPDYALIYPELTYKQPPYLTACAGFDALAQAIEAYWNKNATEESDVYALKAIDLIFDTLPNTVTGPNDVLRKRMSEGTYWAGKAINITKTTAPHAFSYPFTSHYGIPHGHAVALTFPYIADYNFVNGKIPPQKVLQLKKVLGISSNENVMTFLKNYIFRLGLITPPYDYDVRLLTEGINTERLTNNPAYIGQQEAFSIIKKATTITD